MKITATSNILSFTNSKQRNKPRHNNKGIPCKHCGRHRDFDLKFWFIDCCVECYHAGKEPGYLD